MSVNIFDDLIDAAQMQTLTRCDSFYRITSGLTAALPCGPSLIGNQDVAHVSSVLTELNLMTYDLHGKLLLLDVDCPCHSPISLLTIYLILSHRCVES